MTKEEAVKEFVSKNLSGVPTRWVETVAKANGEEIFAWPMWGTMFIVDEHIGSSLTTATTQDEDEAQPFFDEEMAGAEVVLDSDGDATSMYLYEVDGEYLIGVHAAGFNFYDGVWDGLYDALGLKWHEQ